MSTLNYHTKRILFIPLIAAAMFLFAYITMILWNALVPELFNLPEIGYWQAAGLLILTRLLFGFGHGGHHHRFPGTRMDSELRRKLRNMSPEEKKDFFRKMHYNREMWVHKCNEGQEDNENEIAKE